MNEDGSYTLRVERAGAQWIVEFPVEPTPGMVMVMRSRPTSFAEIDVVAQELLRQVTPPDQQLPAYKIDYLPQSSDLDVYLKDRPLVDDWRSKLSLWDQFTAKVIHDLKDHGYSLTEACRILDIPYKDGRRITLKAGA